MDIYIFTFLEGKGIGKILSLFLYHYTYITFLFLIF